MPSLIFMKKIKDGYEIPENIDNVDSEDYSKYNIKAKKCGTLPSPDFEKMCGLAQKIFGMKDDETFDINPLFVEFWNKGKEKMGVSIRTNGYGENIESNEYFEKSRKIVEVYDNSFEEKSLKFIESYKKNFRDDKISLKKCY